jgi:hypothetical protein
MNLNYHFRFYLGMIFLLTVALLITIATMDGAH